MARCCSKRRSGSCVLVRLPAWLAVAALGAGCSGRAGEGGSAQRAAEPPWVAAGEASAESVPLQREEKPPERPPSCLSLGASVQGLSVVNRALVGSPSQYTPDPTLREQHSALRASQRERRRRAWQIAERVLAPVALAEEVPHAPAQILRFQSWHGRDDITRIFRNLYADLTDDERQRRARFHPSAIEAAWRADEVAVADLEAWTEERRRQYVAALDEAIDVHGLGGLTRVTYSPEASLHLLLSYPEALACGEAEPTEGPLSLAPVASAELQPALQSAPTAGCVSPRSKPVCLRGEFPPGAVIVKASFRRAEVGVPLGDFDTSAAGLGKRLVAAEPSWLPPDGGAAPSREQAFTLRLPNGNRYWLAGLHIMTKELDDWFWLSLWWSADPSSDFGADRPRSVPAPFDHYKMCAVVDFVEGDAVPWVAADAAPSLEQALTASWEGLGGPTWCSNPYIETEPGAASTNCIGCHQHAGRGLTARQILGDPEAHQRSGRLRERESFDADYVFALTQGENLSAMFRETEEHFAR